MTIRTQTPEPESKWWLVPVVLMAVMLAGLGVLITIATNDPSFAVEHDYYRKALTWDRHQAQAARNQALGWRLNVDLSTSTTEGSNQIDVVARIIDDEAEIRGATVELEAFHNARAGEIQRVRLAEEPGGTYRTRLPLHRLGLWEFRFLVRHEGLEFTETVRRDVAMGGGK
jgi:hypothetical protein